MNNKSIIIIIAVGLLFASCSNKVLSGIDDYYSSAVSAGDLRPAELDGSNHALGNLTLIKSLAGGVSVSWNTEGHASVSADGALAQPSYPDPEDDGRISATVTYKSGKSETFTYQVIVPAIPISDSQSVSEAAGALAIGYRSGDSAGAITADISLPAKGLNGTTVTWDASSHPRIGNDGTVSLVHPEWWLPTANTTAAVTALVSKGGASESISFDLTVASTGVAPPVPGSINAPYDTTNRLLKISFDSIYGIDDGAYLDIEQRTLSGGTWTAWDAVPSTALAVSFPPGQIRMDVAFTNSGEAGKLPVGDVYQFRIRVNRNGVTGEWEKSSGYTIG